MDEVLWAGRPQCPMHWRYKVAGHLFMVVFVAVSSLFLSLYSGLGFDAIVDAFFLFYDQFGFVACVFPLVILTLVVISLSGVLLLVDLVGIRKTYYVITCSSIVIKKTFPIVMESSFDIASLQDVIHEEIGNGLSNVYLNCRPLWTYVFFMNFPRNFFKIHPMLISVENGKKLVFLIKERRYELQSCR